MLVLQTRIKPLELGLVPKRIELLHDGHAFGHALLGQQRIAGQLQHGLAIMRRVSAFGKFADERLDDIEYSSNLSFVMREHGAFGQCIGHD